MLEQSLDAVSVLGAEDPANWQASGTTLTSNTTQVTQGTSAISFSTPSWASITSAPFSMAGHVVGGYFAFDLYIPGPQVDPNWNGTVDAFVSIPSRSLHDVPLGTQSLNGRSGGRYHAVSYKLIAPALRAALASAPEDVSVRLVFTVAQQSSPYVVDNVRFDYVPSEEQTRASIGFEDASDFTAAVPLGTSTSPSLSGNALAVQTNGYTVVNMTPIFTGGFLASDAVKLSVFVPTTQTNPGWWGDVELRVLTHRGGTAERSLGTLPLTGRTPGQFHELTFAVPEDVRDTLRQLRTDAQFRVVLNVPAGNGTYYLDQLAFAPAVTEPERTNTLTLTAAELLAQARAAASGGGQITLSLFGDLTVTLTDVEVVTGSLGEVFKARVLSGGGATLSISNEGIYGFIRVGSKSHNLLGGASGPIRVAQFDIRDLPRESEPEIPTEFDRPVITQAMLDDSSVGRVQLGLHTSPIHDVLVVYTPAAVAASGSITNLINTAETLSNDTYARSNVDQRIRIVHHAQVNYVEDTDFGVNKSRLQETNDGQIDEVHALRDRFGADLVVMLVSGASGCGEANLAVWSSDADDDSAFAVLNWNCIQGHTFAHEIGHVSGAHHDVYMESFLGVPSLPLYAHGYVDVGGTPPWRTVMAYPDECTDQGVSCDRIGFFSNPNLTNTGDGVHPGDGRVLGDSTLADNVRRLNETAITLEGFRIQGPRVSLYEGNEGTQDHVCVVSTEVDTNVNFTDSSDLRFCDNDEARSLKLFEVPAGRVIRVYDQPDGGVEDDWVEIRTKRDVTEKLVGSFENGFEDADVRVVHHGNNGLDGKVSRLEISSSPSGALIDLHEGNNATQDLVCSVGVAQSIDIDFQNHDACDNDEARSATLYDVPAGTVLRFFDSPSGAREDDWTEVIVKQDIADYRLDTFETSFEDDVVRAIHHHNNGLDGKVSRLEVTFEPTGATIDFHEGNNATQNLVCSVPAGQVVSINFQDHDECDNDEARSLTLYDFPTGSVVFLYDSPEGNREDDWAALEVLRPISSKVIGTFESSFQDDDVRLIFFSNNGLDGKVSRLEVNPSGSLPGTLSFYEGNNGTQNKVCDLGSGSQVVRFPSHSACDNDEARSLVLTLLSAGTRIELFDDPDCTTNDDWTEIDVKRIIERVTIDTFEQSFENDDVRVVHHHDNGLDGKVSCARIVAP